MQKIMVTVDADGFKSAMLIEPDRFDDPSLEAATRIIEKNRLNPKFTVTPVIRCIVGKQVRNYNTYWVLVNAARYDVAERLRKVVLTKTKVDLAQQPYHGGNLKLDAYA